MTKVGGPGPGLTTSQSIIEAGQATSSSQVATTQQVDQPALPVPVALDKGEAFQQQFGRDVQGQTEALGTDKGLQDELKKSFPGMLKVTTDQATHQLSAEQIVLQNMPQSPVQRLGGIGACCQKSLANMTTPGGHSIAFQSATAFEVALADGKTSQFALEGTTITITQPDGSTSQRETPTSLVLSDGTKLSINHQQQVAVVNDHEFASIREGKVNTNNKSSMKNALYQTLNSQGLDLQDILAEFKAHDGNLWELKEKHNLSIEQACDFSAGDLDLLFYDGDYLVMDGSSGWVDAKDATDIPEQAQSALKESGLGRSLRQQKFWSAQYNSLFSQIMQMNFSLDML